MTRVPNHLSRHHYGASLATPGPNDRSTRVSGKVASQERKEIYVLLVDDHQILRDGVKSLMEATPDVRVVAMANTAKEALQKLEQTTIDVVITDMSLPDESGIWLVSKIRSQWPELPIQILSMHSEPDQVVQALEAGATGYMTKIADKHELLEAIRTVAAGNSYLQPRIAPYVISALRSTNGKETLKNKLTSRDMSLLRALAEGCSNRDIGEQLHISVSSVKTALRGLYKKLDVSSRTEAVVVAMREGVLEAPKAD